MAWMMKFGTKMKSGSTQSLIDEYGQGGDTESIRFEPSDIHEITLRDEEGNWIRFDPMPNDYWKISQGTSKNSENQPLDVDLVSGDEFDLIERVKQICGTPAVERKIFLHRNGQTYGPTVEARCS